MPGFLMTIRLALVPKQSAETARPQLLDALHHSVKQFASTLPSTLTFGNHKVHPGRRHADPLALRKPLPNAGTTVTDTGDRNRNVIAFVQSVAERGDKAALRAVVLNA